MDFEKLKMAIANEQWPLMIIDQEQLDKNIDLIKSYLEQSGKKLRMATKSVRVPGLIHYILKKGGDQFRGVMAFSAQEAEYLAAMEIDDILVAYPCVQEEDFKIFFDLTQKGNQIYFMVDLPKHIDLIEEYWERRQNQRQTVLPNRPYNQARSLANDANTKIKKAQICVDVDMSFSLGFGKIHIGVQRSSVRSINDFKKMIHYLSKTKNIRLAGVMGYEAQVAGLAEQNPFSPFLNPLKKLIKKLSIKYVAKKRHRINEYLKHCGLPIKFFNGGGTGSLSSSGKEPWLTELTAGSGFLQSHLFDYYTTNKLGPAIYFVLPITRNPRPGVYTCHSGGFIASGEISKDKAPIPVWPSQLRLTGTEGCGEVQTPILTINNTSLKVGDPIFFRPAKAGEIAERFAKYLLVDRQFNKKYLLTYRGEGKNFF